MDIEPKDIAFMIFVSPILTVMIMATIAIVIISGAKIFATVKKIVRESKKDYY